MTSISTLCNMAVCAAGAENQGEINKALSPKGLLEYIINFFTFGSIRKGNKELYRQIDNNIIRLINSSEAMYECTRTGVIALDDIQGNKVTFNLPSNNNEKGTVIVRVSDGKQEAKGEIPGDKFKFLLATLMRQGTSALDSIAEENESEAGFEFDDQYIDDNSEDYMHIHNKLYASVDSLLDEALDSLDVEDVNDIIKEGGVFSVSSKDEPIQSF